MAFLEVPRDAPRLALVGVQVGTDFVEHLREITGPAAPEGAGFDVVVEALGGVQLGGVAGQEVQLDQLGVLGHPRTHDLRAMAAVAARKQHGYTGAGKAATNGWTFWRYTGKDGKAKPLNELRSGA